MKKSMFIMKGNLCSERVRVARAIRNLTQEELARKIQFMGEENMTSLIISRIEKNQRHVCDAELRLLAKALEVSMEWLVGICRFFRSERFELLKKRRTVPVSGLPTVSVGYMKRFVCAKI